MPLSCLTYATLDHCRQAYLTQYNSSPPEIRHHCHVLLFILSVYLFPIISFAIIQQSITPTAFSPSCTIQHSLWFTMSPHTTTSATSQQTYFKLAAPLLSQLQQALRLLSLHCFQSLSPAEAPPPALLLAGSHGERWYSLGEGDSSQALGLNKGQLVKQRKRKDRDCLCSIRSLGLPMEETLGW